MCSMSVSEVLGEPGAGVGPVDDSAHAGDDALFDGLGIAVVVRVVRRAAVFRGDHDPPPCSGTHPGAGSCRAF